MRWVPYAFVVGVGAFVFSGCIDREGIECTDNSFCSAGELCDLAQRVCVDNVPPKIMLESPAADAVLSGTSAEVKARITDDENSVTRAEISIDDGATWTAMDSAEDGLYVASITLPSLDSKHLNIQIRAFDRLEQEGSATFAITTDNVGPACAAVAPLENGGVTASHLPTFRFQVSVTDGSGEIVEPQIRIGENGAWQAASVSGGIASLNWSVPADQDHLDQVLHFRAKDPHGNACELTVPFVLDTLAPQLSLTSPNPTQTVLAGGSMVTTLRFEGTASDGSPALRVEVDFGDGAGPHVATLEDAGNWAIDVELPSEDYVAHDVVVRAVDAAGNVTPIPLDVIVDTVAPVVTITFPADQQKFNATDFATSEYVTALWTASDADSAFMTAVRSTGDSAFSTWTTTNFPIKTESTDDGKAYLFEVRVTDTTGNVTTQAVEFHVDRLAPSFVDAGPPNNSRVQDPEIQITFSEVVTPTTPDPISVTPADGTLTGMGPGTSYSVTGLKADTVYVYAIAAGAFTDLFGNPSPALQRRFHTAPAVPPSGTTILTDVVGLDATSDEDGVISLYVTQSNIPADISAVYWINPKLGTVELQTSYTKYKNTMMRDIVASRIVKSDLSADRHVGFHEVVTDTASAFEGRWGEFGTNIAPTVVGPSLNVLQVVVPVPAGAADPPGLPLSGHVDSSPNGLYTRGSLSETSGVPAHVVRVTSGDAWDVLGIVGSELRVTRRVCSGLPPLFPMTCSFRTPQTLHTNVKLGVSGPAARFSAAGISAAYPGGKRAYAVVNDAGVNRMEICYEGPEPGVPKPCSGCTPMAPQVTVGHQSERMNVIAAGPGRILGARYRNQLIELAERDLNQPNCGSWTVLGTVPNSTFTDVFWPVMAGNRPGVVYREKGTRIVKLWYLP